MTSARARLPVPVLVIAAFVVAATLLTLFSPARATAAAGHPSHNVATSSFSCEVRGRFEDCTTTERYWSSTRQSRRCSLHQQFEETRVTTRRRADGRVVAESSSFRELRRHRSCS